VSDPVDDAVAAVRRGQLVVFPTDTVYGIGGRPDDPEVTAALFEAKARPPELTLPVLVASVADAHVIAELDDRAARVAAAAWPGPVTLILPRSRVSRGWTLGAAEDTVGVRMPGHPLALALLARTGPIAATSANRSGEPPARSCDELVAAFGDRVAVYLCTDEPWEGVASTVVDLTLDTPRLVRHGALGIDAVERLLAGRGPLLDSGPLP
jgi:L-threonylcarbamoyladenylate synthase